MKKSNEGEPGKKGKKLKRVILFIFIIGFSIFLISLGTAYFFKDDIAGALIRNFNKGRSGQLQFAKVEFDPFIHFPGISLKLDNVSFTGSIIDESAEPVFTINQVYFSFDFIDLFAEKVNITKIDIVNAKVNLEKFPDGSMNLVRAFKSAVTHDSTAKLPSKENVDVHTESWFAKEIALNIEQISFDNILIKYHEQEQKITSFFDIKKLKASVFYDNERIKLSLNSSIEIVDYLLNKDVHFKNNQVRVKTDLTYELISQNLTIAPSKLSVNNVTLDVEGAVGLGKTDRIDLSIDGSSDNISFLKSILSENAIQNIEKGDVHFNGKIVGPYKKELPEISLQFGFKDLKMRIPGTEKYVDNASLEGHFNSGNKRDLSHAMIRLEPLTADLPGGKISANLKLNNFVKPDIDFLLDMEADVTGLNRVFHVDVIDSLQGKIEIKSVIKGLFDPELPEPFVGVSNSRIKLDSVSFSIPDVMFVNHLGGELIVRSDSLHFHDLLFATGNSDIKINGQVQHTLSLLFNRETPLTADLKVISHSFDFPQFFAYNSKIGQSFPYSFKDINLDVNIKTTTAELRQSDHTPELNFTIHQLDATMVDFLAPVNIKKGVFNLGNKNEALLLSFKGFELQMADAELNAAVEYYSDKKDSSFVSVDLEFKNANPAKIVYNQLKEIPPESLDGILQGSCSLFLNMSGDSAKFKGLSFSSPTLTYYLQNDTIETSQLKINGKDIIYYSDSSTQALASLSAFAQFEIDDVKFNAKSLHQVKFDLTATSGKLDISLNNSTFLGAAGTGLFEFSPFAELPSYHFSYTINQFNLQNLTSHFMDDTLVTGMASMSFTGDMQGSDWNSAIKNLDGNIRFYAHNLTVHGYDIDRLIGKLKKTQNFDLVDLGAVVLVGPVGLAITKGSELTSLFVNRSDASSVIAECKSDWKIQNGILSTTDVAFTTEMNRIAAQGVINLNSDSLDISVALLNKRGCSEISQKLHGQISHPKISSLKVAQSIVQPVINLAKEPARIFCKPFYTGSLAQPEKKKKVVSEGL